MKNIEVLILILIVGSITVGMFNVWIGFSVFLVGGYFLLQVSKEYKKH